MEEKVFLENFSSFPHSEDDVQKFGVILRNLKLITKEEWDQAKKECKSNFELIKNLVIKLKITAKQLAEIEANILNIPYIDLESTQISTEVFKILKVEIMKEHKVIPIKLMGQELLVGMVEPAKSQILSNLQTGALVFKPAKVLYDQLFKKIEQMTETTKPSAKKGPRKRLGDILLECKYITEEQLKEAIENSKKEKLRLGAYLVKKGVITNKQLSIALSKQFDIPFIDLDESLVDPVLASLLPKKLCYDQILCPVKKEDNKLIVAMTDPTDIITIDHIEMMTGLRVKPVVSSELSIMAALGKLYGDSVDSLAEQISDDKVQQSELEDLGSLSENDAPIIKLVNLIFTQAIESNTSDIHIEPFENELRVRFRKDGVLRIQMTPTKAAHAGVVSRIKVMANLDIAETRLPQDGRIKLNLQNRKVDMRVSTVPCAWGEKVCIRLLDQGNLKVNLNDLGFEPFALERFIEGIKCPNGIVLVTGPTGSGKTTTLYSSLFMLNTPTVNIMTAEDPVEYNLMGINQVQCHPDIGLDFAAALRAFLRQDPNIIMIGEIRDFETANIAIKAALTGHLVISTLHTNDAPSTIARLLNMGVEPFSVSSSLRVVEAQRLVRKICKACYTEYKPTEDVILSLGINQNLIEKLKLDKEIDLNNLTFAKGSGCSECDNSGYKGRIGIYEVLTVTQSIRELIERRASTEEMRAVALAEGMLSLRESAIYKLLTKKTSVEEVFRTTLDTATSSSTQTNSKVSVHEKNTKTFTLSTSKSNQNLPPSSSHQSPSIQTPLNLNELNTLTQEIQAFRQTLEKLNQNSSQSFSSIQNEIIKLNITDPFTQLQNYLKKSTNQPSELPKLMPFIQAQIYKIDYNLKNLSYFLAAPSAKLEKLNLNELIEKEIILNFKNYIILTRIISGKNEIGQGLKLTKNLAANLPSIQFDKEYLKLIIQNIIINALYSLNKDGEIKILTRLKPNMKNLVELVIYDSGPGIPPNVQSQIFTPFNPINRKTLGLGLAVSKKLASSCNSEISIQSKVGHNTIVTLTFQTVI